MTTDEKKPPQEALALPAAPTVTWLQRVLTAEQRDLVKKIVAPGATDDELALFFWRAKRSGLDPFKRQIHFIKRRRRVQVGGGEWRWEEYPSIETGIEGYRLIADRTTALDGIRRGCVVDEKDILRGAWAEVYRKDWKHPARAEVDFDEFCPRNDKGEATGLWKTKPRVMIEKVAESTALRMAFPEDLSDLYIHEELDMAEHVPAAPGYPDPMARPLTSTEQAHAKGEIVDAEIVKPPAAPVVENAPTVPGVEGARQPLAGEPVVGWEAPDPVVDPRPDLVVKISEEKMKFTKQPSVDNWKKVCVAKVGTAELSKADPSALQDFLQWVRDLRAGKPGPAAEVQKILKGA